MSAEPPPRLAREFLAYYLRHPTAVDTCEGLARWRLLEEHVDRTLRETEEALAWLVEHGFLRTVPRAGGRTVFFMNQERLYEAQRFVAAPAPAATHGDR